MSTLNVAAKTLVSVASNLKIEQSEKWRPSDHLRFVVMLVTWVTVWVFLGFLMDLFPMFMTFSPTIFFLDAPRQFGSSTFALPLHLHRQQHYQLLLLPWICFCKMIFDGPSVQALGRALTHILALMNEIPATSRKYQFAMAMADQIMNGNSRVGHVELLQVNRTALYSAFALTLSLLYRSIQQPHASDGSGAWISRFIRALPLGSYISSYLKGLNCCIRSVTQTVRKGTLALPLEKNSQLDGGGVVYERADDVGRRNWHRNCFG
ncbi:hypothetical protein GH714_024239 [Hevea brasiliensis]|uniref:Uncharacterized protein n=1 Tax=Hevea brasiliensis TaxID=3981 RepID=A0A6A6NDB7_HEVBR|nr:hypothetical protein GH714_024239 [Hevea brasiliensis]